MKHITADKVLETLDRHQAAGCHVDTRLLQQVRAPGDMYLLTLPDATAFLSLIWQSINQARPLVPVGQPRTLRDCAARLAGFGWHFQTLVDEGYPWFSKCLAIDAAFDRSKFGWLALTPPYVSEQKETPQGTHYVYDGVHKSIVLAKRLIRREIEYASVEALLLTPRRS